MTSKNKLSGSWIFQSDHVNEFAYWDEVFTKEECNTIIGYGANLEEGLIKSNKNELQNAKIRDSEICWIFPTKENEWVFRRLVDVITNLNQSYFGFELVGMLEGLQLTKYEAPGGLYVKHIDKIYGGVIRKLSITVQLSDPADYEGGDLCLHFSDTPEVMGKSLGKLVAFPSYALHEVTPVTKGTRYSLVAWVAGKPFK